MYKRYVLSVLVLWFCLFLGGTAWAEETSLYSTVDQALHYSPRLKLLKHNRDAVQYDYEQSRGEYLPSIDLILGYGVDQYSDQSTRSTGADPSDMEWDRRGDATLSLTQQLYDGGETKKRIEARKALVGSVDHRVYDNAQAIALDAIIAHLDVYRQRELLALAHKSVALHQDILTSLEELRSAGAGSVADVVQVQGRMARIQSSLYATKADLVSAEGRYLRLVGVEPETVGFSVVPKTSPTSLAQALDDTTNGNPKVLALKEEMKEASARVDLAEASYRPKLNLELKSNYRDQVEGDSSYSFGNEAMLRLRWNLFNGGQDKSGVSAAKSRKMQSRSKMEEQLIEVLEETNSSWAQMDAAKRQVSAYREAVQYNKETLESYIYQFNVSQRSLLDVLDAENEYYQSSGQLITSAVNETVASYRLLALAGRLKVDEGIDPNPDYFQTETVSGMNASMGGGLPLPLETPETFVDVTPDESLRAFLSEWVLAWQSQTIEAYISFYSPDFVPERGRSIEQWEAFRRKRLSDPEQITILLDLIEFEPLEDGNYRVNFHQDYSSNLYQDQVQKSMDLEPWADAWRILREVAVPANN